MKNKRMPPAETRRKIESEKTVFHRAQTDQTPVGESCNSKLNIHHSKFSSPPRPCVLAGERLFSPRNTRTTRIWHRKISGRIEATVSAGRNPYITEAVKPLCVKAGTDFNRDSYSIIYGRAPKAPLRILNERNFKK